MSSALGLRPDRTASSKASPGRGFVPGVDINESFEQVIGEVVEDEEFRAYRAHSLELVERVKAQSRAAILEEVARARQEARANGLRLVTEKRRARRDLLVSIVATTGTAIVALASAITLIWFPGALNGWIPAVVGLAAGIVFLGSLGRSSRLNRSFREVSLAQGEANQLENIVVRDTLRATISGAYSSAIADLLAESGLIDFPRVAPRLVELNVESIVPMRSIDRVTRFILDHPTSAIGITGPRGAGKSTLLQAVCDRVREHNGEAILLPSPVEHNALDLLRSIAVALRGEKVHALREERAHYSARLQARSRSIELLGAALFLAFGFLAMIFAVTPIADTMFSTTDPWLLILGLAVFGAGGFVFLRLLRRRPTFSALIGSRTSHQILDEVIESLTFEVAAGSTFGATVNSGIVELAGERSTSKTSRDVTHSQLSAALRDALISMGSETPGPVLLAIDELDKLPNRAALLGTVNALKDLLHLKNVHVAVTLSDEALGSFELRETAERDAFDSTFDTIIDVDRLDAESAVAVVDSRVTGFPRQLSLLCFVWAGGLPRDLLRHARACVEYVKDRHEVPAWHAVGLGVTELETKRKLDAAVRSGAPAASARAVLTLSAEWVMRAPTSEDLRSVDSLDEPSQRLCAYVALRYAATWVLVASEREGSNCEEALDLLRNAVVRTASSESMEAAGEALDALGIQADMAD
ncbi:SoxR reducing system RseC family protein [Agromyces badenianii]|uniref:SoxR reducing system RseC family protein n=1 Tax=Agromyces badenianii TaxID=2080742 RepID=UPI000D595646|nr:SoxR reducing system RseC family protein [Agromyces badenianii]PWC05129.1 hypothetical protein DCE94_02145 [Agromyces badenianii]